MIVCGVVAYARVYEEALGSNQSRENTDNCTFQVRKIIQTNPDESDNFTNVPTKLTNLNGPKLNY